VKSKQTNIVERTIEELSNMACPLCGSSLILLDMVVDSSIGDLCSGPGPLEYYCTDEHEYCCGLKWTAHNVKITGKSKVDLRQREPCYRRIIHEDE
jgi:hypothetical protein